MHWTSEPLTVGLDVQFEQFTYGQGVYESHGSQFRGICLCLASHFWVFVQGSTLKINGEADRRPTWTGIDSGDSSLCH